MLKDLNRERHQELVGLRLEGAREEETDLKKKMLLEQQPSKAGC